MKRLSRRVLAFGILGIWLSVLGMHVRREYFRPETILLLERARSLNPGTFFYTVSMNGQAIGLATTRLDTVGRGFTLDDRLILDVPALDDTHRAVARTAIVLDSALRLQRFDFQLGSEIGDFSVRGTVRDSTLNLELKAGEGVQRSALAMDPALLLDAAVPIRMAAANKLQVGQTVSTRIFNPSVLSEQVVDVRVTARDTLIVPDSARLDALTGRFVMSSTDTIPVWRIEQVYGGIAIASWVDDDGQLVKAETPLGYTLERTAFELADQDWKTGLRDGTLARGYGAVIERTAIAANVNLANVAAQDSLRLLLSGVELKGFDLSGGRQRMQNDTLVITRENAGALRAGYGLPYRGTDAVAAELASSALIQSTNPEIVRTARQIAQGSTDPAVVAQRLNQWVYRELRKDITLSVPSAEQVLRARQGDCNEHTVLYLALARALGLPARSAAGVVQLRGRFYYHAWPEVWLGNQWVAVDPTLGQYPADASHVRFIVGGLARQVELIRLIGRLQIHVI